jgi:hypothetical protein
MIFYCNFLYIYIGKAVVWVKKITKGRPFYRILRLLNCGKGEKHEFYHLSYAKVNTFSLLCRHPSPEFFSCCQIEPVFLQISISPTCFTASNMLQ